MRNFIFSIFSIVLLSNCTSETEKQAINKIGELYGGSISSSKGISTGTSDGTNKYFEVEIENPDLFQPDVNRKGVAGNCAIVLYNQLSSEEQSEYTIYNILFKNENFEEEYNIKPSWIKDFVKSQERVNYYLTKVTEGNIEEIYNHYIPEKKKTIDSLALIFKPLKEEFGSLKEIQNLEAEKGEYLTKDSNQLSTLIYRGFLVKEQGIFQYEFTINQNAVADNIVGIRFGVVTPHP